MSNDSEMSANCSASIYTDFQVWRILCLALGIWYSVFEGEMEYGGEMDIYQHWIRIIHHSIPPLQAVIRLFSKTIFTWKALIVLYKGQRLTFKKRTEGNWAAFCSTALLKATHGSAQGAQKLRQETLLRSAERSSLKCFGELTWTRLLADISMGYRKLARWVDNACTYQIGGSDLPVITHHYFKFT